MLDQRVYLKVKVKSLATEAKIIRNEEKKNKHFRNGLAKHRVSIVRPEARVALLAYGFLRNRSYNQMESKAYAAPDWAKVEKLVKKYAAEYTVEEGWEEYRSFQNAQETRYKEWSAAALKYFEENRVKTEVKNASVG